MICECHGHIILDGISYKDSIARHENGVCDALFVRKNLEICAGHGIKFYRDGGDRHMVSALAKKLAPEYGIDYRTPIYIIHKKGYYGGMFGKSFEDMAEYLELVKNAKKLGADFIKITVSGILDFSGGGRVTGESLSAAQVREMVKIANGEGFSVMAHASGAQNIKTALEAGVSSIEHGFYMDNEAITILKQTGTVWVPTCATVLNLIGSGRFDDFLLSEIFTRHISALKHAASAGAYIASGSDAGAACVPQGSGTLDECAVLRSHGIPFEDGNRAIMDIFRKH